MIFARVRLLGCVLLLLSVVQKRCEESSARGHSSVLKLLLQFCITEEKTRFAALKNGDGTPELSLLSCQLRTQHTQGGTSCRNTFGHWLVLVAHVLEEPDAAPPVSLGDLSEMTGA